LQVLPKLFNHPAKGTERRPGVWPDSAKGPDGGQAHEPVVVVFLAVLDRFDQVGDRGLCLCPDRAKNVSGGHRC
jgi:hypothetical protein